MGQALYRKYRSKSLGEIVGQEHITRTLEKALKTGRISHAYLFSGPRGVGKTSIARILAHQINDLPYTDDSAHLDIIEIDAASNRRIDEIRELREKVYIAPTSGKYKVYIIDEVHMLTREAFNALLKTLEEPPAHTIFILATTEAHKLPETIISRTQHYMFKPVEESKVIEHLQHIAREEGITIEPEAVALLAAHGEGSFRDSIGLLDQASSIDASLTVDEVRHLLGIAPVTAIDNLIATISAEAQASKVLSSLGDLYGQGLQAAGIASQLADRLRGSLISRTPVMPREQILTLLRKLIDVPASHNPERLLEITLLEILPPEPSNTTEVVAVPKKDTPAPPVKPEKPAIVVQKAAKQEVETAKNLAEPKPAKKNADSAATPKEEVMDEIVTYDSDVWPAVLESIKREYNTLYGVLRMAQPIFNEDGVELQFSFAFHQKRLNEAKNRKIIGESFQKITGKNIKIECTYNKDATPAPHTASQAHIKSVDSLDNISSIFGGAEVIES